VDRPVLILVIFRASTANKIKFSKYVFKRTSAVPTAEMCILNQIAGIYIEILCYACDNTIIKLVKDLHQITQIQNTKSSQTTFSPKPNKTIKNIHTANPINFCDL
jgi:hypothetical protein